MDLNPTEALKRIRGHLHAADALTDESSVSALMDTMEALRDSVRALDESLTKGGPSPAQWTTKVAGYKSGEFVIEVHATLTEPQFRHIGTILGQTLGSYKGWSDRYVFEADTDEVAQAVLAYLREQRRPHRYQVESEWL